MRLQRDLIYSMIVLFAIGVGIVLITDITSAWNSIAIGIMTGAFVGLVTSFVDYWHHRAAYLKNLASTLFDISQDLLHDYHFAKLRVERLNGMSKDEIIKSSFEKFEDDHQKVDNFKVKYAKHTMQLCAEEFVPLFTTRKKSTLIDDIEQLVRFDVGTLHGDLLLCYSFSMLGADNPDEVRDIVIGDPDVFFDDVMQDNVDFRDQILWDLNKLRDISIRIKNSFGKMELKGAIDYLDITALTAEGATKGQQLRNPREQKATEALEQLQMIEDDGKD